MFRMVLRLTAAISLLLWFASLFGIGFQAIVSGAEEQIWLAGGALHWRQQKIMSAGAGHRPVRIFFHGVAVRSFDRPWYASLAPWFSTDAGSNAANTVRVAVPLHGPVLLYVLCYWLNPVRVRRKRRRRGLCTSCGYDLRASTVRCPECGQPIG